MSKINFLNIYLPAILQSIAWPIAHIIFRVFGRLTIEGKENLAVSHRGLIIAANHAHEMDPILMRAIFPIIGKHSPMFYVARKEDQYNWKGWRAYVYGDRFFKSWGAYPTYKGTYNYSSSLHYFINLVKERRTICIFPAGIQKKPLDEVSDIKGGLGYLAHISGLPVVPVLIEGTLGITWKDLFSQKTKLKVTIGKPVRYSLHNPSPPTNVCKKTSNDVWRQILKLK